MADPKYSKRKGYSGESEAVEALREAGQDEARRNGTLHGANDVGDIAGVQHWTLQVKNVAVAKLPEYLRATREQAERNGTKWFAVMLKLRGRHMRNGAFILPMELGMELIPIIQKIENRRKKTR